MNYRSINDLNRIILKNLNIIPRDIDLIVGVPRSGMLPANLLALYLNLPYTDIHSFINGFTYESGARKQFFDSSEHKRVLVVDDSIASGAALEECKEKLEHLKLKFKLLFCVIYAVPEKVSELDYVFETV
jgi:adenine/guanine phosphoribosyltransferase-like PRPP-binding protein